MGIRQGTCFVVKRVVVVDTLGLLSSNMQKKVKVKLSSLNPHILCKLCNGYLVDAATITECLHTFCKSCLMRHVGLVNRCPTCNAIIHETQPLYNIRLDRTMQDIVHKLLPRLDREEKRREKKFYKSRGMPYPLPSPPEVHGSLLSMKKQKSPTAIRTKHVLNVNHRTEDQISLQLELHKTAGEQQESLQPLGKKFVRCSTLVTVGLLQRFLATKLKLASENMVGILHKKTEMGKDITLKFINDSLDSQEQSKPLVLQYKAMDGT